MCAQIYKYTKTLANETVSEKVARKHVCGKKQKAWEELGGEETLKGIMSSNGGMFVSQGTWESICVCGKHLWRAMNVCGKAFVLHAFTDVSCVGAHMSGHVRRKCTGRWAL